MKTLKFENKLAELILSGEKDSTWRIFDDKDLSIGDELILINSDLEKEFAKATITFIREKKIKDIEERDYDGHEEYKNTEKMIEVFKKYYGDKLDGDSLVKIIKFKLI